MESLTGDQQDVVRRDRAAAEERKRKSSARQAPDLAHLGAVIREQRKALGLTQHELAEQMGWHQERVSLLETGKYGLPSLPLLAHLAQVLQLSLRVLTEAIGFGVGSSATHEESHEEERADARMLAVRIYTLQRLLGIQALTLKDAMNEASDLLAHAMGADKVDLFIHEAETDTLVALGTSNTDMGRLQHRVGLNRAPLANGGRQVQVFLTGEPFYTGHAETDSEIDRGIVHTLGVRSLCAIPFQVDGTSRGVLVAESAHPDRFSESERQFFGAAAGWVGMVAHRAQLHEDLTRRTVEETRQMVAEEMLMLVAHDLGNQITPIKTRLDLIRRRQERVGSDREREELDAVSTSLARLGRMVTDLLDVSRLEGGVFSLSYCTFDLVELVREVAALAQMERPEIEVRTPSELIVEIDPGRVRQILQNLVGNAVQHTPAGVTVVLTVHAERRDNGEWAVVKVHDEGPGIAPDLLPEIFTRHRAVGKRAGLGLGLYLARGIAVAHGGDLTVQSEPGQGTTFTLALPINRA